MEKQWHFSPIAKPGAEVSAADWLGEVKEGWLPHKIMVPFIYKDKYTLKSIVAEGNYKVSDKIAVISDTDGNEHEITMMHKWPVKVAIKAYNDKPRLTGLWRQV
jgi:V/A-type H+-transporting ATPase subunit A